VSDELAGDRRSEAASPWMIVDPDERARREAENGLTQFDTVVGLVERFLAERWRFALRISTIMGLHRDALLGIHPLAGNFRPSTVEIHGSKGSRIPGTRTIPDLISQNKKPYYDALETADEIWAAEKRVDLTALEELLENLLAGQLVSAVEQAKGQSVTQ
jgi:hypothetical protein